eukprot:CAMPEP_0175949362 /NCGR_PEP_ID=MMETSP0108-20121206/28992_1 /TAXON_ID=195067 ORGANISM="Goniomonas pacifica, Strain CCMP1869" /NCGR_SAMPLE_ID=MMETSP0108 /ASSEMBLY_ACC=CAM_ASM_000204 /LENGTH=93 /DNA_ID=CAMNT_0017275281 /DNA_START=604 /DNA_END=885 /DNA_ORIENTATION=+
MNAAQHSTMHMHTAQCTFSSSTNRAQYFFGWMRETASAGLLTKSALNPREWRTPRVVVREVLESQPETSTRFPGTRSPMGSNGTTVWRPASNV